LLFYFFATSVFSQTIISGKIDKKENPSQELTFILMDDMTALRQTNNFRFAITVTGSQVLVLRFSVLTFKTTIDVANFQDKTIVLKEQ
jgi:hypothetical protein